MNSYNNYEWFLKTDLSEYSGQWLAIIDKKVIAYGKNVEIVIAEAKKRFPNKRPLITKIRNKLSILYGTQWSN